MDFASAHFQGLWGTLSILYFWGFAAVAVLCGLSVVLSRSPLRSAISLITAMVAIAALFLQLHSEFLAYFQVIVYAGAVMVLIVFTVSLLNLREEHPFVLTATRKTTIGLVFVFLILFGVYQLLDKSYGFQGPLQPAVSIDWGSVSRVARALFTTYLFPFEFVSLLLTGAVVGAAVLARQEPDDPEREEEERL